MKLWKNLLKGKMPTPLKSYIVKVLPDFFFFLEQPELGYSILFFTFISCKECDGEEGWVAKLEFHYAFLVAVSNESNAPLRNFS